MNEESGIEGDANVQAAAKPLVSSIDGICARQEKQLLNAPCWFFPTQSFPDHMTNFLSNCF